MPTKLEQILTHSRIQFAIVSLIALLLTSLCYGPVLLNPGSYMFGHGNDAVKNYYALAWYVEHEEGLSFGGMKYPHEGYYLQTDGHAPLGILLNYFGATGAQAVALINWLMIISIPLSIVLFYLVFRRLKIHWLWALIASLSVIALSPQIDRLESHFALSYMFFFPLVFLLLLGLSKRRPWVSLLGLTTILTIAYFLHPYLGVMLSFIVLGFVPYYLLQLRSPLLKFAALVSVLAGIIPLALWKIVVNLTDPVANRTSDPWGFSELVTRWKTLLMPRHDWPGIIPTEKFPVIYWEGMCYIGVGGYILALGTILLLPRLNWSRRSIIHAILLVLPCTTAIILAFGYPFSQFPEIVERFSFLQQFRALGRLSWIFYYLGIGGMFYLLLRTSGKRTYLYKAIAGIAAFFFLLEGAYIHNRMGGIVSGQKNLFSEELQAEFLDQYPASIFADIEAIVPAPMYYVGSDTYGTESPFEMFRECLTLSMYTGIPTSANSTSREPVIPSIESIHLTSPSYYPKGLLHEMDSSYHSVGILTNSTHSCDNELTCCGALTSPLVRRGEWQLFSQRKSQLERQSISLDSSLVQRLNSCSDTLLSLSDLPAYSFNFDSPGLVKTSEYNPIGEFQNVEASGKIFNFSCWLHNPKSESHPGWILIEKVSPDSKTEWINHTSLTTASILSGDSVRFEVDFQYPDDGSLVRMFFLPSPIMNNEVSLNHVLVRPVGTDVFEKRGSSISKNNHLFMELIDGYLQAPKAEDK